MPWYMFDIVEWETDVNKAGAKETNERYKAKYGTNLTGEAVDAYLAMYLIKEALEQAGSLDPAKIRQTLADIELKDGPGMIVGYDSVSLTKPDRTKMRPWSWSDQ